MWRPARCLAVASIGRCQLWPSGGSTDNLEPHHTLRGLRSRLGAPIRLKPAFPDVALRARSMAPVLVAGSLVAGHKPAAPINVCKTLPSKGVRAIPGVGSTCAETSPLPGIGSVEYTGTWTATPGTAEVKGQGGAKIGESLGVTIARFTDSGALRLAVQ